MRYLLVSTSTAQLLVCVEVTKSSGRSSCCCWELARQHWQDRRDTRDRSNVILAGYGHRIGQG